MRPPAYPDYKPSEVDWLRHLPVHWASQPLKRRTRLLTEKTDRRERPVALENIESWTGRFLPTETEFEGEGVEFRPGDILFGKLRPYLAKTLVAESQGEAVGDFLVIRCAESLVPEFLGYQLRSREVVSVIAGSTFGSKMPRASWDFVGALPFALPPADEQNTIVAFLDRETAKIDALIAEQEKLIALLAEKRLATVSRAVTRGLDPAVPMRDSGVPWLGEVPANWRAVPLKHLCLLLKDGTHLPPQRVEEGVPLLSVRNVDEDVFSLREDDSKISSEDYSELCRAFVPKPNDVVLAIVGATLGKVAIIPGGLGDFHIQRSLAIFRASADIRSRWLFYVMASSAFQRQLWMSVGFSAQPGIYLGTLREIRMPVPPIDEQAKVSQFLDEEIAKLSSLRAHAEQSISLLRERRSALITAAVTGQIDVRGTVPA